MKPIMLAYASITIGVAHGQDAEAGRDRWAREFTVDAPKILDPPITGILQGI